jgi:hypothetical protein
VISGIKILDLLKNLSASKIQKGNDIMFSVKLPKIYKTFQIEELGKYKNFIDQQKVDELIYAECKGDYQNAVDLKLTIKELKTLYLKSLGVTLYFSGLKKA